MKVPPEDSEETCVGGAESVSWEACQQEMEARPGTHSETCCPDTDSDPDQHNQARAEWANVLGVGRGHQLLVGGREAFLFPTGQVI